MTRQLAVTADPRIDTGARTVAASLPLSYRWADGSEPVVTAVDGTGPWGQLSAAALTAGAPAVIVTHPAPEEVDALRSVAPDRVDLDPVQLDRVGWGRVVLSRRWGANPVVPVAATELAAALPYAGRIECQVLVPVGTTPMAALVDQLGLLRALLGPARDARVLCRSRHGYAAVATVSGHPADLTMVSTDAVPPAATVRLLTSDGSVELAVPDDGTARPGELVVTGPSGSTQFPTIYESGQRAAWRRAHDLLTTGGVCCDVELYTADLVLAQTALHQAEG